MEQPIIPLPPVYNADVDMGVGDSKEQLTRFAPRRKLIAQDLSSVLVCLGATLLSLMQLQVRTTNRIR